MASVWQCVSLTQSRLSPTGAAAPSHLHPVCPASSCVAAGGGATGAFSVGSPQDRHESSVKSPHRLPRRPPRKLTRPARRGRVGGAGGGGDTLFFFCVSVLRQCHRLAQVAVRGSNLIKSGFCPSVFVCFYIFFSPPASTFAFGNLANL